MIPRTAQALVTLDLIDAEGNPTETLESLRRAAEPEFKNHLAAWIRAVYADVLSFVEPTDDETKIRDAFRPYNPVGQQPRMVALFLGLCRAAALRPDDTVKESRPRLRTRLVRTGLSAPLIPRQKQTTEAPPRIDSLGLPPPLAGLLNSLPESRTWSQLARDKFLRTFEAVLDYSFTVVDQPTEKTDD